MYLFLGTDTTVRKKDVVGIFDLDTATISPVTRAFLSRSQKEKQVQSVNYELPKSFVVTADQNQKKVYLSPLSASVLKNRAQKGQHFTEKKGKG